MHLVLPPHIQLQVRHLELAQTPMGILHQVATLADEIGSGIGRLTPWTFPEQR
jgi:hypothetical protein